MSSAYSNSIGRIPVGCVYAARAEATIEDTEVMSLVYFLGSLANLVKVVMEKFKYLPNK